jgi:uncharacterized protein YjiS (DUF1127 family)
MHETTHAIDMSSPVSPATPATPRLGRLWSWIEWLERVAERQRQRRLLDTLDAHMLADIGISRAQALHVASKPFWRD